MRGNGGVRKKRKRRSLVARLLRSPLYRQRVIGKRKREDDDARRLSRYER